MIPPDWPMERSASGLGNAWRQRNLHGITSTCGRNGNRRPRRKRLTRRDFSFAGLAAAFDYLRQMGDGNLAAGRDALVANAELCAAMTRAGVEALGLKLFRRVVPAAALTAVAAPRPPIPRPFANAFAMNLARCSQRTGGNEGQLFRIAHIGYYRIIWTRVGVLAALEQVIAEATGNAVEFGSAVRAAQEVMGRSEVRGQIAEARTLAAISGLTSAI